MTLVDTHFHLDLHKDELSAIEKIEEGKIYTIAVTNAPSVFFHTRDKCRNLKYLRAALGYHPEVIGLRPNEIGLFEQQLEQTRYVGEIGLDKSGRNKDSFELQLSIFSKIINLCHRVGNKILTIHSRRSEKEVLDILGDNFNGRVILHYYSGSIRNLKLAIRRGYYFSINYNMTKTKSGREIIAQIPLDNILTESDYPFLDVGVSLSDYLLDTIREISLIKNMKVEFVEKQIFLNFKRVLS
ncbi:MAG: TatD family hydrolase [Bacteroidales bacterium]|jgi:TatD DNase family protein|nr:TatD family hydrolase [Bacteroidales bacterium]